MAAGAATLAFPRWSVGTSQRCRTDLLVQWPLEEAQGFHGPVQRAVIALKILHQSLETTVKEGLAQTAAYMDRVGTDEGYLIVFDRTPEVLWEDKSDMGNTGSGYGGM